MPYTAQQVLEMVQHCRSLEDVNGRYETDDIEAALTDYAARLEQQEQRLSVRITKPYDVTPDPQPSRYDEWVIPDQVAGLLREEGRREVYEQIAALMPTRHVSYDMDTKKSIRECAFCLARNERGYDITETVTHAPDCLYLKATQALTPTSQSPPR